MRKVWFDGKIIEKEQANIGITTHSLHYGSCVFEGIRIYYGKPFLLEPHMERLVQSANLIGMNIGFNAKELAKAAVELVNLEKINYGYIRPFSWYGEGALTIGSNNPIHTAIITWESPKTFTGNFDEVKPVALKLSEYRRISPSVFPIQSKCAALYAINTYAKHKADEAGYDDALFLDANGYVAEGGSSNIFMVKNGKLITPIADSFLNGITRQEVIKIAREIGIEVIEARLKLEELMNADEVFLVGTTIEVCPVRKIEDREFAANGLITRTIYEAYIKRCTS